MCVPHSVSKSFQCFRFASHSRGPSPSPVADCQRRGHWGGGLQTYLLNCCATCSPFGLLLKRRLKCNHLTVTFLSLNNIRNHKNTAGPKVGHYRLWLFLKAFLSLSLDPPTGQTSPSEGRGDECARMALGLTQLVLVKLVTEGQEILAPNHASRRDNALKRGWKFFVLLSARPFLLYPLIAWVKLNLRSFKHIPRGGAQFKIFRTSNCIC